MDIERFSRDDATLIVIDVQNDFCHPDGAKSRSGCDVSAIDPATDRLIGLIDVARRTGVPVIFVVTAHGYDEDSAVWRRRLQPGTSTKYPSTPLTCVLGTWGAEFYRVSPEPNEPIVTKHRYSGFVSTDLERILDGLGRRSLFFAGFATNVCVETTMRDGLCRDYMVSIVEDCCAAFDKEEHTAALVTLNRYFGVSTTADELSSRWS